MAGGKEKAVQFLMKAKKTIQRIIRAIKFFATPLGTVLGWILFILFAVLLLYVVVETVATSFKDLLGFNTDYVTYDEDKEVLLNFASTQKIMDDIYSSGYSSQLNPNDYINYKAFEYSVLMDAAEYIRLNGQEEFDVAKNQGIYTKERKLLSKLIAEAEAEKAKNNPNGNRKPVVTLLPTTSKTDQSVVEGDTLKNAIAQGNSSRNINVIDVTGQGADANKTTTGGNNRVMGPFLVYEFVYNGMRMESGDNLDLSDTITPEGGEGKLDYVEEDSTAKDLFSNDELGGSIIPYLYVVREEIDFSYYFNKDNEVLEIPLLLNAYNSDMGVSVERSKEIKRATKGVVTRVWPDLNMDKQNGDYTWVPYYTDETNCTVYKIPLKTLIGRYMPKTELLYAWTMLKKNITQDSSVSSGDAAIEMGEEIANKIKQIYNDACLNGEKVENKTKIEKNIKTNKYEEKPYKYDTSNQKSFVTFEKAGIETTKYKAFKSVNIEDLYYISDFKSAYVISDKFTLCQSIGNDGGEVGYPMSLAKMGIDGVNHGNVLMATGNPDDGYIPASNLKDTQEAYYYFGKKGMEDTIKSRILEKACESVSIPNDGTAYLDGIDVEYVPIFIVSSQKYTKVLEIEHRRMPILLVKSAITWSREVVYSHAITQNLFEQTDHSYLVPNCVSSMGMQSFVTSEMKNNYRGKAYEDVFAVLQEKDVISMLLTLETYAEKGDNDCYEYMRELYKLVMATQDYSQTSKKVINPDTYTYVYMQDSILYYDDKQTQKIYWLELLGQRGTNDALTREEIETVRTRDPVLKWQIIEYEKYDECNGKVYALNPFGSAYVRAYVQLALDRGMDYLVDGAYEAGSHEGADLTGRSIIDSMLNRESASEQGKDIASKVYEYSLNQLMKTYTEEKAEEYLKTQLLEQSSYMPIVAVAPGIVRSVGFTGRSGFYVTIIHDEAATVKTIYCHLKRWPNVNVGDHVGAGTVIGYEGNTGRSSGTHLHFQMSMSNAESTQRLDDPNEVDNLDNHVSLISGTVNPVDYIYPTFTPFYYYEKAEENDFDLANEYMTLYRTVFLMDEENPGSKMTGGVFNENSVPKTPLLNDYRNLVQDQGKREYILSMSGDLDWPEIESGDVYIREEYLDINKAKDAGLLEVDPELLTVLYGYIPVKTDMPGALPELTREELEFILQNWLSKRYNKEEFEWLMKNVFTEDTIEKILEAQEEYKVSAVFALAVGTLEQQLGLSYYRDSDKYLGKPGIHNIFSIKGNLNGGINYIDETWNVYDSYGDAFMRFSKLIAGGNYFEAGRFTIATIGPTYCPTGEPPGASWSKQVTTIAIQIMQYYTGSRWSSNLTFVDNSEFLGIARNFITLLANAGYDYGYSVTDFNPFTNEIEGSSKQIDCTAYVSGVIRAYGKMHNIPELQTFNEGSSGFCSFANSIANGKTTGAEKYFEVIWIRRNKDYQHPDGSEPTLAWLQENMLPGDIIVFYAGHSRRTADKHIVEYGITAKGICSKCPVSLRGKNGAHHAEIFTGGWEKGKSSVFSCGSGPGTDKDFYAAYSKGEPVWNRCLFSTAKTGNTRYTLYAIIRLKSEM